jgi:type I restriction-modification system DNA methylase subunit
MKTSELVIRLSEIAGLLKPVLPPDAAAEAPAIFFFLKIVTSEARSLAWTDQLPAITWTQLSEHEAPEAALLELMARIESLTPEFKGLGQQSHLARNLSGRTDLRPHLRKVFDYVDQTQFPELSPAESAQTFQDLLQRFEERTMRPATPSKVARFAVRLVSSEEAKSVFDPSCGSATFLSAAANLLPKDNTRVLEGEESQESIALLARIALWLGGWRAHVQVPDSESGRSSINSDYRTFDIVLANPPFGLRFEGPALFAHEGNRSTKLSSEVAFVDRIDRALAPKGRAAILVPTGLLSRHGSDHYLRKDLVARDRIEAVIMLPGNLFAQTKVSVALLILHANKVDARKRQVVFVDLTGREDGSGLDDRVAEEIRQILNGGEAASPLMRSVDYSEISANDFELGAWRYLTKKKRTTATPAFQSTLATFRRAIEYRNTSERAAIDEIKAANQILAQHSAGEDERRAL